MTIIFTTETKIVAMEHVEVFSFDPLSLKFKFGWKKKYKIYARQLRFLDGEKILNIKITDPREHV